MAEELVISGFKIGLSERREIYLKVSESFLASSIQIPVTIIRGNHDGPTVFLTAAIHGDEINGIEIVRRIINEIDQSRLHGTLLCVPVVNIPGFLNQTRYLAYNRDLNRYFPGSPRGNNAERVAFKIFQQLVVRSDWGIDLHTAASGRSNMPHVRGDMSHPKVRKLARAFGSGVIIDNAGRRGSLRRVATENGFPTIVFEAGETGKFSREISEIGYRGVVGVLRAMGVITGKRPPKPPYQVIVKHTDWLRAERGGILDLFVKPGHLVYKDEVLGVILNPFGRTVTKIRAPHTGVLVGVSTQPLAIPGTGICHIARLSKTLSKVERHFEKLEVRS
ncbi:MAG: succinylglutamate desuccinylase/aspartoacylase family protein [Bdellovibrionota bacterium]